MLVQLFVDVCKLKKKMTSDLALGPIQKRRAEMSGVSKMRFYNWV